ncbi:MAG: glycerol-3-phosphate 1-O-acyltransferase PlsY [Legionellaceae bacterium]|nr:glycerol-3-phosphate 1-O-acyltransferase PlsY [Legionellaceae bacterium]MBP9774292.1 glycerol-3-phosphate 1-O-acyltransferase PlsY [Legionellaceae bacterium]
MVSFILIFGVVMLATYGIGSLCSAVIVAQLFHLPDPRLQGSRNPGTTNILRIAGKKYAVIVLLADLLKGLLPVFLLKYSHFAPNYLGYIGLIAVLGHIYPVFFNFKGGKGVATGLGVLFGLNGWLGLAVVVTWILVAWATRYSSLAGMLALGLAPVYLWFLLPSIYLLIPVVLMVILVLSQHLDNMLRLWHGKESKIKL